MAGLFPQTTRRWARIALLLNLIPGMGTMVAGGNQRGLAPWSVGLGQFGLLVLALVLAPFAQAFASVLALLAVAWSLAWGVLILMRAA